MRGEQIEAEGRRIEPDAQVHGHDDSEMKRVHSGGDDDDAQEPIEAGKMVHMGVRYESVADAQELAR